MTNGLIKKWMPSIRHVRLGHVLAVLLLVGCGPWPAAASAEASDDRASSVAEARTATAAASVSAASTVARDRVAESEPEPPGQKSSAQGTWSIEPPGDAGRCRSQHGGSSKADAKPHRHRRECAADWDANRVSV